MNTVAAVAGARPVNRAAVVFAVMAALIMQTLDSTIVNVALPQMQGELGCTPDEASWVLTSYVVAVAIFMPLTGFLADRIGQRLGVTLLTCGFVLASVACGAARSLDQLVAMRILQGAIGAMINPLAMSVMINVYPLEQRGRALAWAGTGAMIGPVLGPSLGGWLTEAYSWRWTFFINLPIGLLAAALAWLHVPPTPTRSRSMDWRGFALLGLALGAIQYTLDRGNRLDWFDSGRIVASACLGATALAAFVVHALGTRAHPVVDLRVFRDRNYSIANLISVGLGVGMFGTMIMQPLLMESVLQMPPDVAGMIMAPRGVAVIAGMLLIGRLIDRVDARPLLAAGCGGMALSAYMMSRLSLEADAWSMIAPGLIQGVATAFGMITLSFTAFRTLPPAHTAEASGVYTLLRSVGQSIGGSIAVGLFIRHTQAGWNQLGGHLTAVSPQAQAYAGRLGLVPGDPLAATLFAAEVQRQAMMAAIVDVFALFQWLALGALPLLLLLRRR
ncbi:MAG: DHA2 family efflux MFS transporter permease subunit [Gammaproteobacteria bacterium]